MLFLLKITLLYDIIYLNKSIVKFRKRRKDKTRNEKIYHACSKPYPLGQGMVSGIPVVPSAVGVSNRQSFRFAGYAARVQMFPHGRANVNAA